MKPLEEILQEIDKSYELWESLDLKLPADQTKLIQSFSCYEHWIGLYLDQAEKDWLYTYDNFEHKTHARKEAHAHVKVPEYKQLKRLYTRLESIQKSIGAALKYS